MSEKKVSIQFLKGQMQNGWSYYPGDKIEVSLEEAARLISGKEAVLVNSDDEGFIESIESKIERPYTNKTLVDDLEALLASLDLDTKGKKSELLKRLDEYYDELENKSDKDK